MQNTWQNTYLHIHQYSRLLQITVRNRSLTNSENYYDILKVRNDCSTQEIRDAFVQLSKKFHPDVRGVAVDPKRTAQFVKISEAYQILSKPKSRLEYDQRLFATNLQPARKANSGAAANMQAGEVFKPWEIKPNYDPNPGPYYGVKGLERIPNWKIAVALTILGIAGAIIGFISVNHSFTFNRRKLDSKSAEASFYHAAIRADAEKYGNEEQLRRMIGRMRKDER